MLALPGSDDAIELLKLIQLDRSVGTHKEFTDHRLEFGRVIEFANTLFQRPRDTDAVFVGRALMGSCRLQVLAHTQETTR